MRCGTRETGSTHHTMCRCPLARELWHSMALDWPIPKVESICNNGPEWLFTLLDPLSKTARLDVLMTRWRIWYMCKEITHEKAPPPTEASHRFLHGYINSLLCIQQYPNGNLEKGKLVLHASLPDSNSSKVPKKELRWAPPRPGWTKFNTDGSHGPLTSAA